jgi:REP element-mobilizing transposase RayT
MSQRKRTIPLASFLTFTTYGTWLHGREAGSVDCEHNQFGEAVMSPDPVLEEAMRQKLEEPPFVLDAQRRRVVRLSIEEVSTHRRWALIALHVRSNHIHVVVRANADPDKVMNDYKAYASRRLKEAGFDEKRKRRWTEGGSKRFLWQPESVATTVKYVIEEQGQPMESLFLPENMPTEPQTAPDA